MGVPQIGAELEHLAVRIEAAPIPVHDRAHREGMPQIMDARAAAMFVKGLPLAKAHSLADPREVVAGAAVTRAFAILEQEERRPARSQDTIAFRLDRLSSVRLRMRIAERSGTFRSYCA